jgi:23S rRNA (pseudouridine1915-N3)-methyltransferase
VSLQYRIVYVGRRAQDPLVQAATDYLGRLGKYVQLRTHRIREVGDPQAEGREILSCLRQGPSGLTVALDERGATWTTVALASKITGWQNCGERHITFIVGGADGLYADIKAQASVNLSLSAFTLPHRLALVLLAEQLYRAHTYLRGEPYHRV